MRNFLWCIGGGVVGVWAIMGLVFLYTYCCEKYGKDNVDFVLAVTLLGVFVGLLIWAVTLCPTKVGK